MGVVTSDYIHFKKEHVEHDKPHKADRGLCNTDRDTGGRGALVTKREGREGTWAGQPVSLCNVASTPPLSRLAQRDRVTLQGGACATRVASPCGRMLGGQYTESHPVVST